MFVFRAPVLLNGWLPESDMSFFQRLRTTYGRVFSIPGVHSDCVMNFWITRPPSRQPNSEHKKHHPETYPSFSLRQEHPVDPRVPRLSVCHGMQAAVHDASCDQAACSQGDQIWLHSTGHTNGLTAATTDQKSWKKASRKRQGMWSTITFVRRCHAQLDIDSSVIFIHIYIEKQNVRIGILQYVLGNTLIILLSRQVNLNWGLPKKSP